MTLFLWIIPYEPHPLPFWCQRVLVLMPWQHKRRLPQQYVPKFSCVNIVGYVEKELLTCAAFVTSMITPPLIILYCIIRNGQNDSGQALYLEHLSKTRFNLAETFKIFNTWQYLNLLYKHTLKVPIALLPTPSVLPAALLVGAGWTEPGGGSWEGVKVPGVFWLLISLQVLV